MPKCELCGQREPLNEDRLCKECVEYVQWKSYTD